MSRAVTLVRAAAAALLVSAAPAAATCESTPDGFGGLEVECEDGAYGSLREDRFGNVDGHIGDAEVRLRSDGFGGLRGTVGDQELRIDADGSGVFGEERFETQRDLFGGATISGEDRSVECETDIFGVSRCY